MKIRGFECVVGPGGRTRAVAGDSDTGNAVWLDGRLVAQTDIPREVLEWLIRPMLRDVWADGNAARERGGVTMNPYEGEPPNKDKEPS